jgi:hypothetical protein
MQATKKLSRVLRDLVTLLEEEASRNPAFAERLEEITTALPERFSKRPGRARLNEPANVPDVLAEFQTRGADEFRFWLRDFSLPVLKAIVKRNGFDPARATQRWTEPDKFVTLITEQVRARLKRGSAFITSKREGEPGGQAGAIGSGE